MDDEGVKGAWEICKESGEGLGSGRRKETAIKPSAERGGQNWRWKQGEGSGKGGRALPPASETSYTQARRTPAFPRSCTTRMGNMGEETISAHPHLRGGEGERDAREASGNVQRW